MCRFRSKSVFFLTKKWFNSRMELIQNKHHSQVVQFLYGIRSTQTSQSTPKCVVKVFHVTSCLKTHVGMETGIISYRDFIALRRLSTHIGRVLVTFDSRNTLNKGKNRLPHWLFGFFRLKSSQYGESREAPEGLSRET